MKRSDLKTGMTVYHSVSVTHGAGVVKEVATRRQDGHQVGLLVWPEATDKPVYRTVGGRI